MPPDLAEIPGDVLLPPPYTIAIQDDPKSMIKPRTSTQLLFAEEDHLTEPGSLHPNAATTKVNSTSPAFHEKSAAITSNHDGALNDLSSMYPDWAPEPDEQQETRSQFKGVDTERDLSPGSKERFPAELNYMLPVSKSFKAVLIKNERVTPESHWQDVRLLTFKIPSSKDYEPGDTVTILPKNFPQDVQALIDLQDWNEVADIPLIFKAGAPDWFSAQNLVTPPGLVPLQDSTLRELLLHNLDITAIPNRHFFNIIANHTDDPMHRERLLDFTNPIYTDEFFDYTTRPRRSILEVLQDFPSVKLPWEWATTLFPHIRGRQFSICSGGELQEISKERGTMKLQLLVAIVKYKTVLKKIRQGLCSRYIASLPAGTVIGMTMAANQTFFKAVQASSNAPVIMVGPGTGVAPCRSLIWQRASEAADGNQRRQAMLFFGNRNKKADYFEDEWKDTSLLVKVFTAFSRDQREKIYVQDLIRREGAQVNKLISEGGLIVVCGSSGKMPKQVRNAFLDVMEEHGGPWNGREEVEQALQKIEKKGMYLQETW